MPLEATNTSPANEVPAEAAYMAARDRAMRTTQALMDAEARIVDLSWRLDRANGEIRELNDVVRHTKELMKRRTETLRRRAEVAEGVTHDATDDEGERPTAGGEADTAHAFSD